MRASLIAGIARVARIARARVARIARVARVARTVVAAVVATVVVIGAAACQDETLTQMWSKLCKKLIPMTPPGTPKTITTIQKAHRRNLCGTWWTCDLSKRLIHPSRSLRSRHKPRCKTCNDWRKQTRCRVTVFMKRLITRPSGCQKTKRTSSYIRSWRTIKA